MIQSFGPFSKNRLCYTLVLLALLAAPGIAHAGSPEAKPAKVTFTSTPTLSSGAKDEVLVLQDKLKELGHLDPSIAGSRNYGNATKNAVLAFKREYNKTHNPKLTENKTFTSSDWNALAASLDEKALKEWQAREDNRIAAEAEAEEAKKRADAAAAEAAAAEAVTASVSADEFDNLGLKMEFDNDYLKVSGSLPEACASKLKKGEKKIFESESASVSDKDSLDKASSRVAVELVYQGTKGMPTLAECVEKNSGTKKNVSLLWKSPTSGKPWISGILSDGEFASVDHPAESKTYKALLSGIVTSQNCKDCELGERLEHAELLRTLNFDGVRKLEKENFEEGIKTAGAIANDAKSLRELERARSQLENLGKSIDLSTLSQTEKEALMSKIAGSIDSLIKKGDELATAERDACQTKQEGRSFYRTRICDRETEYADFIASSYSTLGKLPGMDESSREDALNLAADYTRGGQARVNFISNLDPTHEEVTDALRSGTQDLRALQREVFRECRVIRNAESYSRCVSAQQDFTESQNRLAELQKRYQDAQSASIPMSENPMMYGPQSGMQMQGPQPFVNPMQPGPVGMNGQNGMFAPQGQMFQNPMFQGQMFGPQNAMFAPQGQMFQNPMFQGHMFAPQGQMFPAQMGPYSYR